MPRIAIVNTDQFGYHTDTYQYCRHLRHDFEISYICWDYGQPEVRLDGVRVVPVSRAGSKVRRLARFIRQVFRELDARIYDVVFVEQFPLCGVVPLLRRSAPMILDIRTGYVRDNGIMRLINNTELRAEALFFRHVTIISESLRRGLGIPGAKSHVLPLGADQIDIPDKDFSALRLFYVGSLDFRHIDATVAGFERFASEMKGAAELSYDIVGFGSPEEERKLREAINRPVCRDLVKFHGRVPNKDLFPFLERNNIGVGFIPLKKHYQCQPATKVFEYLLAGMAVIATRTIENARVIGTSNGILTDDTPEGFYRGLREVYANRSQYDSSAIKAGVKDHQWDEIIRKNLVPFLQTIMN